MNSNITIRPFKTQDLTDSDELLEVLKDLTKVENLSAEERSSIAQTLSQHPYYLFVAEKNGKIVGTLTLLAEQKIARGGRLCGHIEDVVVLATEQGTGIGSLLINQAIEKARQLGCYKLILDCNDNNIGYYEKCGFKKVENCMRFNFE